MIKQIALLIDGTETKSFNYKTYLAKTKFDHLYWSVSTFIEPQNSISIINNNIGNNRTTFEVVDITNHTYQSKLIAYTKDIKHDGLNTVRRNVPPEFEKYAKQTHNDVCHSWNNWIDCQTNLNNKQTYENLRKYANSVKTYTVSMNNEIKSKDPLIIYQEGISTMIKNAIKNAKKKFSECWCLIIKDNVHIENLETKMGEWKKIISDVNNHTRIVANKQLSEHIPIQNCYFWFGRIYDLDDLFNYSNQDLDKFPMIYSLKKTNKCFRSLDTWYCQKCKDELVYESSNIAYAHLPCGHPICQKHSQSIKPKRCFCEKIVKTRYNCVRESAIYWDSGVSFIYIDGSDETNIPVPVKTHENSKIYIPHINGSRDFVNISLELQQPTKQKLHLPMEISEICNINAHQVSYYDIDIDNEINIIKLLIKTKDSLFLFDINSDGSIVPNKYNEITEEIINTHLFKLKYCIESKQDQYQKETGFIEVSLNNDNDSIPKIGSYFHGCWQDRDHMKRGIKTNDRILQLYDKSVFFMVENFGSNIPDHKGQLSLYSYVLNRIVSFKPLNKYIGSMFDISDVSDINTNTSSIVIDCDIIEKEGFVKAIIIEDGVNFVSNKITTSGKHTPIFDGLNKSFKQCGIKVEFMHAKIYSVQY